MNRIFQIPLIVVALFLMNGCTPEVGTEAWCKMMEEKPKGDWSANEVTDYAKHCIIR